MSRPKAGLGTKVKVERVIDGDTLVVSITRSFPLRIKGLRCPEKNEKGGLEAKAAMQSLVDSGAEPFIFIHHPEKYLTGINTFDRIIGDLYFDEQNAKDWMIEHGYGIERSKEGIN